MGENEVEPGRPLSTVPTTSDIDPPKTPPGSKADPSTNLGWNEHVKEYFNEDATPGEAQPSASHEAKE